ncbi:regulatory LuxR family protein [Lutibacter sp. Hel_I_33_5]|uniref:LuxR C-terminal-related transcriptional regulator n=1 Tax=Lutibacter sp. Hel_I_33_5 TaxID=1566289 RepID=UPI0011A9DB3E|nr:LuxR C-terminal-related transcriptional regulator [Lutibacter sp. Hel_I_33_5]TVZ55837.1 regulatory LuxR family protein [Lutibacter sp. Hel_I_33_5]
MSENTLDIFKEIFKTQKEYQGEIVEKHINKLRELDEYLPPIQSFFIVTNTTTQLYEFVSKNFEYALGLDIEKMETIGASYWFSNHHPEDLPIWMSAIEDLMLFTMTKVPLEDRSKLTYTWNFRVKNAQGEYLNLYEHQSPTFFDETGKPIIGVAHCSIVGNGEPRPIIGVIKKLNDKNEYETIYYKNYSQKLLNISLSNRELDVIRLIALNNTTKQIADKLFLSHHTISTHRKNILRKLNLSSVVELVNYSLLNQLL